MKIKLFIDRTVQENAAVYFDKSKKLKKKLEGVMRTIQETKQKLASLDKDNQPKKQKDFEKIQKSKDWFSKFYHFYTTNNFLVVGGKSADSNEELIKKYLEKDDLVFHTQSAGSPFVIVKHFLKKEYPSVRETEEIEKYEKDIEEIADYTFSLSNEGKIKSYGKVYCFLPFQITKKPKSGEYLKKGGFMIYGERLYLDGKFNLGIAIKDSKVILAPVQVIKNFDYLEFKQLHSKKSEVVKKIMSYFKGKGFLIEEDLNQLIPKDLDLKKK